MRRSMKRLLLLRHAKSDRPAGLEDYDRPLNARGRRAAPRMGEEMLARGLVPDAVLVSPARRTCETWQLVAPKLGLKGDDAQFIDKLYLASAKQIFDLLRQLAPETGSALLIGHNPGIEDIAARLASERQSTEGEASLEQLKRKYPTCALTVIDFQIDDWTKLSLGSGAVAAFLIPASLED